MLAIVRTCWNVCRLHSGPQVFPRSWTLFSLMLAAYIVVDTGLFLAQGVHGWLLVPELVLDVGLLLAFFALVLLASEKLDRYNQTEMALLGSLTLIMLVDIPITLVATRLPPSPYSHAAGVLQYGILSWSVLVVGYVVAHALSTRLVFGILIAGLYTLSNLLLSVAFFPIKS